jgi:hypothetical protein
MTSIKIQYRLILRLSLAVTKEEEKGGEGERERIPALVKYFNDSIDSILSQTFDIQD